MVLSKNKCCIWTQPTQIPLRILLSEEKKFWHLKIIALAQFWSRDLKALSWSSWGVCFIVVIPQRSEYIFLKGHIQKSCEA